MLVISLIGIVIIIITIHSKSFSEKRFKIGLLFFVIGAFLDPIILAIGPRDGNPYFGPTPTSTYLGLIYSSYIIYIIFVFYLLIMKARLSQRGWQKPSHYVLTLGIGLLIWISIPIFISISRGVQVNSILRNLIDPLHPSIFFRVLKGMSGYEAQFDIQYPWCLPYISGDKGKTFKILKEVVNSGPAKAFQYRCFAANDLALMYEEKGMLNEGAAVFIKAKELYPEKFCYLDFYNFLVRNKMFKVIQKHPLDGCPDEDCQKDFLWAHRTYGHNDLVKSLLHNLPAKSRILVPLESHPLLIMNKVCGFIPWDYFKKQKPKEKAEGKPETKPIISY